MGGWIIIKLITQNWVKNDHVSIGCSHINFRAPFSLCLSYYKLSTLFCYYKYQPGLPILSPHLLHITNTIQSFHRFSMNFQRISLLICFLEFDGFRIDLKMRDMSTTLYGSVIYRHVKQTLARVHLLKCFSCPPISLNFPDIGTYSQTCILIHTLTLIQIPRMCSNSSR